MAGSGRFELASGSTEGSTLTSTFPNGQRGNYSGANLDRSGSFRDGAENRILSSGSSSSRGSTTLSLDMPPLSQCMMLEPITLGDQKFTRSGELRRIFGVSVGNTSEDHSFGAPHYKPPPPIGSEEIKRFKASLLDTSTKARDRVKKFQESIFKLDKYRHTFNSRKRRAELSSSERSGGANPTKMGNQIQQNPLDLVNQRLDKNVGLNKRVRTSVAEVSSEARNNVLSRQTLMVDKERDMLKCSSGGSVQEEQKTRGMPAGGDGWDRKMKRKRSVGAVVNRAVDGDQELKRAIHQKLSNDPRSRALDSHGFGSGPSNGVSGINKLDGTSQLTNSNGRSVPRTELENVPLQNDRKDRAFGLDKERVVAKANNKLNILESNQVGNHSPVTKGKASRAPRTGSCVTSSSPNVPRTPGPLDGWEQPSCLNKVQSLGGVNNRKRPISTGSSSPVAQCVGQRSQKNSRTRRANLVSPVSNHDEVQTLPEGYPTSEIGTKLTSSETTGSQIPKGVSNRTQQYKMKLENVSSPARFSESEESGAGENKLKEKHVDYGEREDRSVNAVKKVGPFISSTKKNKSLIKEDAEDGVRRQGRTGRGSLSRASFPPMREKLDSLATTKPMRSMRPGFDKNESKSGRPPSRKLSERKAFTRPGSALNSGSSGFTGESDDDHEELVAAANSACNASYLACSGSFWKKVEPIFASVSSEDTTYLRQQGDVGCKEELVSQPISCGERLGSILNGIGSNILGRTVGSVNQLQEFDTLCGMLDTERRFEKVTPLYQRVLSALIGEDEIEDFDHVSEGPESFQYASDDSPCVTCINIDAECKDGDTMDSDLDSEVHLRTQRNCCLDNFSCDKKSNSLHIGELCLGDGELVHSEIGTASVFGENHLDGSPSCTYSSTVSSSDCRYELMCLDDKLMLELQSIGLYPERVPDLAEGGEQEINKDILELKKGLYRKVGKKKGKLSKIDKALLKGREVEGREIEQIAMNKLVEMAYKKRSACRGGNFSRSGVSKVSKVAALAFVKRTIARCRKFEESGRSCFSEPALQEVISSAPPYSNDGNLVDIVHNEAAANTHVDAHIGQLESGASGAVPTTVERHGSHGVKFDRGSSNAFQSSVCSSDLAFPQHEPISNRGKKREVLLEDVGNAASRAIPVLGNMLSGGAKGRRSERDRDQNKDMSTSNSVAKTGRPSLGSFRGERKTKTKPKQKIAQLSTSGNGLLDKIRETTETVYRPVRAGNGTVTNDNNKVRGEVEPPSSKAPLNSSKETEEPVVFANLHFNELDSVEELGVPNDLGGPQDLCSWLNFDEDGLQDHDSMGLEIPMDDLSDLQMLI
ncbi:hypothetical protein BVC80_1651g75 [Macleaya cordata]|uniref:Uncharacterized protein n=1 Tax=Macleaya cordata TaxID=56857 RepID=A0A200PZC4_MACCD|nr:hypothetical protein BVC80_1651g75 [Macleaya cordata]